MSASGVYGTNISASVTIPDDVEIFYSYSTTRNIDDTSNLSFNKIDSTLLQQATINEPDSSSQYDNMLEGLYNLKLPIQYFNKKGYYTVYIKPREHAAVIQDVGVLSSYPDVKGVIIDSVNGISPSMSKLLQTNNSLVGYRIIYYDDQLKRLPYYRIITSNNKCEPIVQNLADTNQKSVRYRYNENSTLTFLTLTPSVSTTYKPNELPYIGSSMQRIGLVNTKFEPIMLDIEMVDHDVDTISTMLEGSQLRDLDNGLVTTFNDKNEIYSQHEHYTLKDDYTNKPVYEVKKNKENSIDFSQTIDDKL